MRRYLFLTLTVGLLLFFGLVGYRSLHHTGSAVAEKQETVSVSTPVALPVVVDAAETPAGAVPHRSVVKTSAKQPAEILQVTGSPGSRIQPIDESRIVDQRITDISKDRKKRELLVNAGGKYPVHRIEETLVKNAGAVTWSISARTEMVADHVLVKLQDGQSEDDLRSLLNGYGVSILRALSLPGHYIVSLNAPTLDAVPEALSVFTSESNVLAYAEPDYISHIDAVPNDTRWSDLWGMVKINATGAWDVATGSTNVIVAVIDTGIDLDHPDLISNLWHNAAEVNGTAGVDDDGNGYIDDANGWDFASDDNVPEDSGQHGTHCAGTIGAVGNNTLGVAGVCWTVRLMALRGGTESALYQSDTADAIVYAADNGAKIISASYGGGCYNDTERDAIVYANSKGVLFVAAAGNESLDSDETPNYPSGYDIPNIVAVAATDRQDALASFSNYGKKSVDLAAPGVDILSTVPGGTYASFQGTSMATPHVAGAAALLLSAKPMLTHLQVKEALLSAVDIISSLASKTVSGGRLNLQKLITMQDTDGDGMPDDWEIANGLATNNAADAAFDPDGDHLNNLGEYENRCIITNADTDADSLVDGWEVTYGFNPNSPTGGLALSSSLGSFTTAGSVANVVVEGNYAYLADGGNGLVILNISNSQNPVLVGSVDTAGTAMDVAVSNGYAYVADGANGLVVVAVSNPALPWIEGSYNTAGTAKGIAAQSNWVYLADGTSGKVEVFDVSTPASPQVGTPLVRMMSMNDVFMRGDSAYVAALANVLRLDISNPSAPQAYANSAGFTGQDIIGIHGNASIVAAAAGVFGVKIMNDASIQARTTLGTYDTDGTASGVFVDGNYVYVADGTNGLVVLDITTPSIPVQTVHVATIGSAVGVFVKNGTVYVAEGETGMEIFSILSDSDRDGLLDSWERTWFGDLLRDGTADYDNDGISDWGEYLAGLDPTDDDQDGDGLIDGTQEVQDYNSDPRLADTDGDGLVDGYDGIVSTNTYPSGVDANSNGFVDGELDFGGVTAGARGIILVDSDDDGMNDGWEVRYGFDPRSSSSPGADGDADSDGLTNLEESINNTDPNNPDTDGDGMPDGWEVDNSFDPLVNDSALDADSDGLTNLQEYTLGTDPHNADTDGDTMPDGWEYSYMPPLNPTNSLDGLIDSDGDGLTNRYEYSNGCNPTNTDTDADGMPDGWEVDNGLDPTDSTGIHGAQGDPDSDGLLNIQEYSLSASNLWQAVYTSVTGSVMVFSYTDSATNTVEYIPGATDPLDNDSDNDGLTDYDEITTNGTSNLYITNPNSTDTDADDLPDNWELAQIPVSDPTVAARPTDDSDGDGLTNQEEGDLGTQAANRNDPIFVDDDAPLDPDSTSSDDVGSFGNSDTNENGTINHPFDAIQEAIGSASTGATILVNDGWYNGPGNCEIDLQGKAVTIRSWHGKDVTTISTLGAGSAFLFTHGEITNTVLQGLTIKGALCESSDGDCDWIDILRIEDSSPVIRDCTIQDTGGNAIQCSGDAHPQFFNCLVANARNGFWCEGGAAPIIVSNVIQHIRLYDEVFPLDEYWGNGIYAVQGVGLELRSTTIEDCQGRGMYVQSATEVLLEDSTVRNSWGGIRFAGVDATLLQCKIQGNEAPNYYQVENTVTKRQGLLPDIDGVTDYTYENENGAGILLTDGCAVSLKNVLLTGNRTWAVDPNYPLQDEVNIETPELWGPDYGLGGGIYVGAGCVVTSVNFTVADNISTTRGGGVSNHEDTSLYNVIAWGNFAYGMHVDEDGVTAYPVDEPEYYELHCRSGTLSVRNGDLWYPYYSDTNVYNLKIIINSNPQFIGGGDYRLAGNSPCIDLGNSNYAPSNDIDGVERPLDGDGNGTYLYDLGAYEYYYNSFIEDADRDGLTDAAELIALTDPNNPDTDGDGMFDGWEVTYSLDPLVNDAAGNADGDTLTNLQEYQAGTNPNLADTDDDGLNDDVEIGLGTQPVNAFDPIHVDDNALNDVGDAGDSETSDPDADGSINHPFDAIQKALNVAVNGSTVLITNGTYFGTGNYNLDTRGLAVTVRSWNGNAVTAINSQQLGPVFNIDSSEGSNTVIRGLTMTSADGIQPVIVFSGTSACLENCIIYGSLVNGIECDSSAAPTISSCTVHSVSNGIHAVSTSSIIVRDSVISNCTERGIWVESDPNPQIRDTDISNCNGGIRFYDSEGVIERCEIYSNTVDDHFAGGGVFLTIGSSPRLANLLIVDNHAPLGSGGGIYIGSGCSPVVINCTVAGNSSDYGGGIAIDGSPVLRNLIVWGNSAGVSGDSIYQFTDGIPSISYCCVQGGFPLMLLGGTTSNPLFVGGGDYHLSSSSSPCVDTGTDYSGGAPTVDLDGIGRPQDGDSNGTPRIDMGCYEFYTGSPDPISNDRDGDGVSDADEFAQGTDSNNSDTDGDGLSDGAEAVAGTDPLSAASCLDILCDDVPFGSTRFTWQSIAGRVYTVQSTDSLIGGTWSNVSGDLSGTGGVMFFSEIMPGTVRYYRVLVHQP